MQMYVHPTRTQILPGGEGAGEIHAYGQETSALDEYHRQRKRQSRVFYSHAPLKNDTQDF